MINCIKGFSKVWKLHLLTSLAPCSFLWCLQVKEQQIRWNDIFENRIEMDSKYYVHADTDKADDEQPAPVILRLGGIEMGR